METKIELIRSIRCAIASLSASDAGLVATGLSPGGGADYQMASVLLKRMNHADQMKVICSSGRSSILFLAIDISFFFTIFSYSFIFPVR